MVLALMVGTLVGQSTRPAEAGRSGVVTGNDVYVRAGFSQNYYPVTKLNEGDEVIVHDEMHGWVKIAPPQGAFSLIDKTYVERDSGEIGKLNGTTWVFAGSHLNNRRYAKQVKLGTGSEVRILGETGDGQFYKIAPPPGAYLWMSGDFVDRSGKTPGRGPAVVETSSPPAKAQEESAKQPEVKTVTKKQSPSDASQTGIASASESPQQTTSLTRSESGVSVGVGTSSNSPEVEPIPASELINRQVEASPSPAQDVTAVPTIRPEEPDAGLADAADDTPDFSVADPVESTASDAAASDATDGGSVTGRLDAITTQPASIADADFGDEWQVEINAIEAEIKAETAKPLDSRRFEPIIERLRPLAQQEEDEIVMLYAQKRIRQLQDQIALIAAVREMRQIRETAVTRSNAEAAQRSSITVTRNNYVVETPSVKGEIRVSGIYDGAAGRPKRWRVVDPQTERTEAYIELPSASSVDPTQYLGQYVEVKASERRFLRGTVPPVPILTVSDITRASP
jgi:hypothetical protein